MSQKTALLSSVCFAVGIAMIFSTGCVPPKPVAKKQKASPSGIIGKTTDEIGEFDPVAQKVAVNEDDSNNPVKILTGPLGAYGAASEQIADLQIQQALNLFNALNGRYPKDHAEFMQKVIKENGIQLPALRTSREYAYDVKNHKLMIVEKKNKQGE